MIRAVLDCNVVITAALSGGKCAELLSRARWVVTGTTRHLMPHDGHAGLRTVEPAVFLVELNAPT